MLGIIDFKNGKILKKFNIEEKLCYYADIADIEEKEKKINKINKNIVIYNKIDIFSIDI